MTNDEAKNNFFVLLMMMLACKIEKSRIVLNKWTNRFVGLNNTARLLQMDELCYTCQDFECTIVAEWVQLLSLY